MPELSEKRGLIVMDHVFLDHQSIEKAGDYESEGLFGRRAHAIENENVRRVGLDGVDAFFDMRRMLNTHSGVQLVEKP